MEWKLTDAEIRGLIKQTGWGLKRAESLNLISNYETVAQAAQKRFMEYLNERTIYFQADEWVWVIHCDKEALCKELEVE